MISEYQRIVDFYERILRDFEGVMDRPVLVDLGGGIEALRFSRKDTNHAIVMKLIVAVSGLNACTTLLKAGHVYEQGVLQRVIDDACEDAMFLALPLLGGEMTERHEKFLADFWAEEYEDASDTANTLKKREMPRRDKIRAYVANFGEDPSTANKTAKSVYKAYSGFVHGAAMHIMEIYDPRRGGFSVRGMHGTPRMEEYCFDIWNYIYRTGLAFRAAAKAFGAAEHDELILKRLVEFQDATGRDGGAKLPDEL
ncbi:hypothetical protein [Pseudoxanthomonas wuyuanensis]